ncbi:hypothetical protein CVT24_008147 [Panaeolus cyanescens]|uniref:Uncharacterized protein n=1 Tax=Panaeolus cyanescens TaxID=181874 RepID=A0A409XAG9_9AGAR|nr:hypothetical protein CVT24_008147 [Panaeolus cyanescens]
MIAAPLSRDYRSMFHLQKPSDMLLENSGPSRIPSHHLLLSRSITLCLTPSGLEPFSMLDPATAYTPISGTNAAAPSHNNTAHTLFRYPKTS